MAEGVLGDGKFCTGTDVLFSRESQHSAAQSTADQPKTNFKDACLGMWGGSRVYGCMEDVGRGGGGAP